MDQVKCSNLKVKVLTVKPASNDRYLLVRTTLYVARFVNISNISLPYHLGLKGL